MLSKPHRKFCNAIVSGLTGVRAYALAGPTMLALVEKHLWLARVVRTNLARLDPEIDGDLLVNLHIENGRKTLRMSKIRIAERIASREPSAHSRALESHGASIREPVHV